MEMSPPPYYDVIHPIIRGCGLVWTPVRRPLGVRIGEHKFGIIPNKEKFPLPRHFRDPHNKDPAGLGGGVLGMEVIGGEAPDTL